MLIRFKIDVIGVEIFLRLFLCLLCEFFKMVWGMLLNVCFWLDNEYLVVFFVLFWEVYVVSIKVILEMFLY